MRILNIKTITALLAAAGIWAGASTSAFAALTLGVGAGGVAGDQILGEVIPSLSSSSLAFRDEAMVNNLLDMTLGQRTPRGTDPEYYRSTTPYGSLGDATLTGAVQAGSIGGMVPSGSQYISIQLPTTTTYQYLVSTYDGPNGGSEVWYIGNVAAGTDILIPRYAHPVPASGKDPASVWPQNLVQTTGQYQITTWTMFDPNAEPTINPSVVPEPTTMVAGAGALGLALLGIGRARRSSVVRIG
jgi:hypothetical protein